MTQVTKICETHIFGMYKVPRKFRLWCRPCTTIFALVHRARTAFRPWGRVPVWRTRTALNAMAKAKAPDSQSFPCTRPGTPATTLRTSPFGARKPSKGADRKPLREPGRRQTGWPMWLKVEPPVTRPGRRRKGQAVWPKSLT